MWAEIRNNVLIKSIMKEIKAEQDKSGMIGSERGRGMKTEEYKALLAVDFGDVEAGELTDISKIRIDRQQPLEQRRQQYMEKVGNPYLVRVGNMKVKIRFADNGISMEDAFENLLLSV